MVKIVNSTHLKVASSGKIVPGSTAKARDKVGAGPGKSIEEVAQEFESIFLGIMLDSMRKSIPDQGMIKKGNAEKIYEQMLDTEYAKSMSQTGQTGLAHMIAKQLHQLHSDKKSVISEVQQPKKILDEYRQIQQLESSKPLLEGSLK